MLTALMVVAAVLAGLIVVLKVVAPMTKTTVDDKVLDYAEKAETVVEAAEGYLTPAAKPAPAPAAPDTK